ncbi:hypothetical protein [Micrococcus terreus]|uniref:hypothetical protein n=1 Tax=Micrococcus terreus TaxID=574650 RepID=UPI003D703E7D
MSELADLYLSPSPARVTWHTGTVATVSPLTVRLPGTDEDAPAVTLAPSLRVGQIVQLVRVGKQLTVLGVIHAPEHPGASGGWTYPIPMNTWTAGTGSYRLRYRITPWGLQLAGRVLGPATVASTNLRIFSLPPEARPAADIDIRVARNPDARYGQVRVRADGDVTLTFEETGTYNWIQFAHIIPLD